MAAIHLRMSKLAESRHCQLELQEVVARHQAGDRAQQGEGPVHTPRACLGCQGQADQDQTRKWISECIVSSVSIKCLDHKVTKNQALRTRF